VPGPQLFDTPNLFSEDQFEDEPPPPPLPPRPQSSRPAGTGDHRYSIRPLDLRAKSRPGSACSSIRRNSASIHSFEPEVFVKNVPTRPGSAVIQDKAEAMEEDRVPAPNPPAQPQPQAPHKAPKLKQIIKTLITMKLTKKFDLSTMPWANRANKYFDRHPNEINVLSQVLCHPYSTLLPQDEKARVQAQGKALLQTMLMMQPLFVITRILCRFLHADKAFRSLLDLESAVAAEVVSLDGAATSIWNALHDPSPPTLLQNPAIQGTEEQKLVFWELLTSKKNHHDNYWVESAREAVELDQNCFPSLEASFEFFRNLHHQNLKLAAQKHSYKKFAKEQTRKLIMFLQDPQHDLLSHKAKRDINTIQISHLLRYGMAVQVIDFIEYITKFNPDRVFHSFSELANAVIALQYFDLEQQRRLRIFIKSNKLLPPGMALMPRHLDRIMIICKSFGQAELRLSAFQWLGKEFLSCEDLVRALHSPIGTCIETDKTFFLSTDIISSTLIAFFCHPRCKLWKVRLNPANIKEKQLLAMLKSSGTFRETLLHLRSLNVRVNSKHSLSQHVEPETPRGLDDWIPPFKSFEELAAAVYESHQALEQDKAQLFEWLSHPDQLQLLFPHRKDQVSPHSVQRIFEEGKLFFSYKKIVSTGEDGEQITFFESDPETNVLRIALLFVREKRSFAHIDEFIAAVHEEEMRVHKDAIFFESDEEQLFYDRHLESERKLLADFILRENIKILYPRPSEATLMLEAPLLDAVIDVCGSAHLAVLESNRVLANDKFFESLHDMYVYVYVQNTPLYHLNMLRFRLMSDLCHLLVPESVIRVSSRRQRHHLYLHEDYLSDLLEQGRTIENTTNILEVLHRTGHTFVVWIKVADPASDDLHYPDLPALLHAVHKMRLEQERYARLIQVSLADSKFALFSEQGKVEWAKRIIQEAEVTIPSEPHLNLHCSNKRQSVSPVFGFYHQLIKAADFGHLAMSYLEMLILDGRKFGHPDEVVKAVAELHQGCVNVKGKLFKWFSGKSEFLDKSIDDSGVGCELIVSQSGKKSSPVSQTNSPKKESAARIPRKASLVLNNYSTVELVSHEPNEPLAAPPLPPPPPPPAPVAAADAAEGNEDVVYQSVETAGHSTCSRDSDVEPDDLHQQEISEVFHLRRLSGTLNSLGKGDVVAGKFQKKAQAQYIAEQKIYLKNLEKLARERETKEKERNQAVEEKKQTLQTEIAADSETTTVFASLAATAQVMLVATEEDEKLVITAQAHVRGLLARKFVAGLRRERKRREDAEAAKSEAKMKAKQAEILMGIEEEKARLEAVALKIQSAFRRTLAMKRVKAMAFRKREARSLAQREEAAAILIQRRVRGMQARKRFEAFKRKKQEMQLEAARQAQEKQKAQRDFERRHARHSRQTQKRSAPIKKPTSEQISLTDIDALMATFLDLSGAVQPGTAPFSKKRSAEMLFRPLLEMLLELNNAGKTFTGWSSLVRHIGTALNQRDPEQVVGFASHQRHDLRTHFNHGHHMWKPSHPHGSFLHPNHFLDICSEDLDFLLGAGQSAAVCQLDLRSFAHRKFANIKYLLCAMAFNRLLKIRHASDAELNAAAHHTSGQVKFEQVDHTLKARLLQSKDS